MSTFKKTILIILVIAFSGVGYGLYMWNKPARNVAEEKGIQITAAAIFDSFAVNENRANNLFVNKAIQVTGEITEIKNNQAGK